jgi:hypothetical protein
MKLISTLIAIAFASTLSFGAVAAQHMGAAPAAAPAATTEAAPAKAATPAKKDKKAKNKTAKKDKKAKNKSTKSKTAKKAPAGDATVTK